MTNSFKLQVTENTFLKLQPKLAAELPAEQKYQINAGAEYPVMSFAEHDDIHFRVAFGTDSSGHQIAFASNGSQPRNTWLIFEGHCMMFNADDTPALQFFNKVPLKLQNFLGTDLRFDLEAIAADKVLTTQIQERLIFLGLLSSIADGKFGPVSADALKRFQELMKIEEQGFLGKKTAKKLIETKPTDIPKPPLNLTNDFASRIIKYMQKMKYRIATGEKEFNIVYVEGVNPDGTPNKDLPNQFNDRRIVITIENGTPKIVGNWAATTEPGNYYTFNPLNPRGAARIKFGQYKAWRFGIHGTAEPHRALIQVAPISVHRDFDRNFQRTSDFVDTGVFAINQHYGFDHPTNDVHTASAGCLVGQTRQGHREFLKLIEQDRRYLATPLGTPIHAGDLPERTYVFDTTVIPGNEL